jgi:uncharacterized damage-inducible protein DinB
MPDESKEVNTNLEQVINPDAKFFLETFFGNRLVNLEFYDRLPEDKLDYRMVDTPKRRSDSPRESIAHQIAAERQYLSAISSGNLQFGIKYEDLADLSQYSKDQLIKMLKQEDQNMVDILKEGENCTKKVTVPWSKVPVKATEMLWGLDSHEILHQGWNLALMDLLGIERFPAFKDMWG